MNKKVKKSNKVSISVLVSAGTAVLLGGVITGLSMLTFSKTDLVVAVNDIVPYERELMEEDFKTIKVSKNDIKYFDGFVTNSKDLVGKIATTSIVSGQPVRPTQFINPAVADDVNSIVSDENNRGIYLNLSGHTALYGGEVKTGAILDFYLIVKVPTENKTGEPELRIIPFQESYTIKKMNTTENGVNSIFFEFPKEENERYLMLQESILAGNVELVATVPNPLHEDYKGQPLDYNTFFNSLVNNPSYFTSYKDATSDSSTNYTISNSDKEITNATQDNANTKPTDN